MTEAEFRRHLKERQFQKYRSTKVLAPDFALTGLIGERAVAAFFGVEQDLRNKPKGDGGTDLEILLDCNGTERWFKVDSKCLKKPISLLTVKGKTHKDVIYVLVGRETETCLGWEWGSEMLKIPPADVCGRGVINHSKPAGELRSMDELSARFIRARHHGVTVTPPERQDANHLCHCGKYAPRSSDHGKTWSCREHEGQRR